eukprot:TRINITY_DN402_c1_g1_i1.p1 TRINITY_DN402_c1_g1~~TRINITY_DN402_c1_g1_i1.p1  ORF type:complete len:415 (-),score=54.43 TRINITY_DN402_c1_g1_i1:10-1254(-)
MQGGAAKTLLLIGAALQCLNYVVCLTSGASIAGVSRRGGSLGRSVVMQEAALLVEEGQHSVAIPHGSAMYTPRNFLLNFEAGPYTCIRTCNGGTAIAMLDFHLSRLLESYRAYASNSVPPSDAAEAAAQRTPAAVRHALLAFGATHKNGGGSSSSSSNSDGPPDCLVTVLWEPAVGGSGATGDSLQVHCHVWPLPTPVTATTSHQQPAVIMLQPFKRRYPLAKHSSWVSERQPLERCKGGDRGVDEVVMYQVVHSADDAQVEILEGLVTNIFAVGRDPNDDSGEKMAVWTAPDGILHGSMRALCIQACKRLGHRVIERAPVLRDVDTWTEMFLTGSGSILRPVGVMHIPQIACDSDASLTMLPSESATPMGQSPVDADQHIKSWEFEDTRVGAAIRAEMRRMLEDTAMPIEDLR